MTTISNETGINFCPPRSRTQDDTEMDITPMIDIVFLLLSFFVMSSKMDPQFSLLLPKAIHGQGVSDKTAVNIVIKKTDTPGKFDIFKGRTTDPGAMVLATDPFEIEQEISDYVQLELSRRPEVQAILIKAEGEVTAGIVQNVKRGISMADMAKERRLFLGVEQGE